MRTSIVKILWIIIGLAVALYFGGWTEVLIEHAGKLGAWIAVFVFFFIVLFLWNSVTAPAKLQREADNEIAALKTKLNDREARQSAMARLWALRGEGVAMRNQKVVGASAAVEWIKQFENWHQRVLAEAQTISPNFHAWLATLDRVRPGPRYARTQYAALMPIGNSAQDAGVLTGRDASSRH